MNAVEIPIDAMAGAIRALPIDLQYRFIYNTNTQKNKPNGKGLSVDR